MTERLEARLARLEKQLFATRAVAAIVAGALAWALFVLTRPPPRPQAFELEGPADTSRLSPYALEFGETKLEQSGLTVVDRTPSAIASAEIRTNSLGAAATIGVGEVGISQVVDVDSPTIRLVFRGRIRSELHVNTETGAWTVLRSVGKWPPQTTQLIAPFGR
jgi:hypothetical protein